MVGKKKQEFHCGVVNEAVKIHLCKKSKAGWRTRSVFFVQCNQSECQYVDENELPCPLSLSMFEDEIREREEEARQKRESSDAY